MKGMGLGKWLVLLPSGEGEATYKTLDATIDGIIERT
jgi:hypothetical protein